jgi:hypothetical protein
MSKRIIVATLLALAVGSNAVLAADEGTSEQTTNQEQATKKESAATEPVTVLYQDNPAITSYERLNP